MHLHIVQYVQIMGNIFIWHTATFLTLFFFVYSSDVDATDSQSAIVSSPNVTMRITDRIGSNIISAQVGDPLMIRFEILEATSK